MRLSYRPTAVQCKKNITTARTYSGRAIQFRYFPNPFPEKSMCIYTIRLIAAKRVSH